MKSAINILFFFLNNVLKSNKKFKNIAKKNECIIFGNGASIKNYNLKLFSKYDAIVTTMMYLHKNFKHLNVVADCEIAPFLLYKFWKNPYSKKIEKNMKLELIEKTSRFEFNHPYFISLTNYFSKIKNPNFNYLYNFNNKNFSTDMDISSNFAYLSGSIFCMMAIAKYMGYKKIIFVGVDYFLDPPIIGHFYEKDSFVSNKFVFQEKEIKFFKKFNHDLEIEIIVPKNSSSKIFKPLNYEKKFNDKEINKNNYEIVSKENLKLLDNLKLEYKIF